MPNPDQQSLPEPSTPLVIGIIVLIMLTIFVAADLLSSLVDFHASVPPRSLPADVHPATSSGPSDERLTREIRTFLHRADDPIEAEVEPSPATGESPLPGDTEQNANTNEDSTGEYDAEPSYSAPDNANAAPGVELQGVLWSDEASIAVLETNGVTHTVATGDTVAGYHVDNIDRDSVALSRDGQQFTVRINEKPKTGNSSRPIGKYPPVLPNPEDVPLPPTPTTSKAAASGPPAPKRVYLDGSEVDPVPPHQVNVSKGGQKLTRQEMDEFLAKGAALSQDVRGAAIPGDGIGVRVRFRNPSNALARLGVKDGDIILNLNGKTIRSMEELYNSCLTLKDSPSASIELMRSSQNMRLFYEFPE